MQYLFRPLTSLAGFPDVQRSELNGPEFDRLLKTWRFFFPFSSVDPELDFEYWVENALQLHLAMAQPDLTVFVQASLKVLPTSLEGETFDIHSPYVMGGLEFLAGDFVGSCLSTRSPTVQQTQAAENYAFNQGFVAHAHRRLALCGFDDGEGLKGASLENVLQSWRDEGMRDAIVKTTKTKKGLACIRLAEQSNAQISSLLMDGLEWTLMHLAGGANEFLVQEHVRMTHEYRVFVVEGKAVAGAGCIGSFTPLNNEGEAFDCRTLEHRGFFGSPVSNIESRPDVVAKYQQALPQIVHDLMQGNPELSTFVLDLCMVDGHVAIVELNPVRNAGYYATNASLILDALIRSAQPELQPA